MAWERPLQSGFKSHSHKRRSVRFNGLWRVHRPPQPRTAHTAAHRAKQGRFERGGSLPSDRFARFRNPAWPGGEWRTLQLFGLGRVYSQRTQRAFGTAMRSCASLFRGVAALPGCVYICRKYINFPSRILLPKSKDRQEKLFSNILHPCF